MSISIDKYFRIWNFLKNNPYLDTKTKLSNNSILYSDTASLYRNTLTLTEDTLVYPKDLSVIDAALRARDKTWTFFSKVFVPGSYAYNTPDVDMYRKMIIDWSSASKTFKDMFLKSTDAFSLDDDDVDKAIRGFGVDFVNKGTLDNIIQRQLFLLALCELYKIKGSPDSITKALTFAGVTTSVLREYWIERNPDVYKSLQVRGIAIGKEKQKFNTVTEQYEFLNDESKFVDNVISYENFNQRLWDISEPHWWYTSDEIVALDYASETKLKLPSKTPYFGIEYYPNIKDYSVKMGILERVLSDQANAVISGNKDLLPTEIGITSDDTNDNSKREIWISEYTQPLTLVECFLSFTYAQIRYDEYVQYIDLYNYLISHGVSVPNSYTYPHSVQELIYWTYQHKSELINGVVAIDAVAKNYIPSKVNYYCSTNELIKWWINKDPINNTENNIPDIFFSLDYNFRYLTIPQDTTTDQILMYNGLRQLDYKLNTFEYNEAIGDSNAILQTQTSRLEYDPTYRSINSNNKSNAYYPNIENIQKEYINTYFDYISNPSSTYLDTEEYDGSSITPLYFGKYPKSKISNWGIDSQYLYTCYDYNKWVRSSVEFIWTELDAMVTPTTGKVFYIGTTKKTALIGSSYLYNQYIYVYVSNNTWVRKYVDTTWDTDNSPISNDGTVRISDHIAYKLIKASINSDVANKYINGISLGTQTFSITFNPLIAPEIKQYNSTQLTDYLSVNNCILARSGYIVKNQSVIYDDNYLYTRIIDSSNNYLEVVWVRNSVETQWTSNGNKIYEGEYKYPNLDLTNRYDAERLLRGTLYLNVDSLLSDTSTFQNGDQRLVCTGNAGYPEMWIYNNGQWSPNQTNTINEVNLGFNNSLIAWIDSASTNELDYQKYADKFLNAFSSYIKIQFRDPEFDVAGLYKSIQNSGLIKNMIDFFKPKRARLLYFSLNIEIDDRLFNSIKIDDDIPLTRITQIITEPIVEKRCCDYYDIGCIHDGPTNPQVVIVSGDNIWSPGQYSSYTTDLLMFDENTNHHKMNGFATTDDLINIYKQQDALKTKMRNPGSTYCNECDTTTYEPEDAIFEIPEEWKRCGVYHLTIQGNGFETEQYNTVWTAGVLTKAIYPNDFPIGYINENGDELVHVYNKETGKYYWEIRTGIQPE